MKKILWGDIINNLGIDYLVEDEKENRYLVDNNGKILSKDIPSNSAGANGYITTNLYYNVTNSSDRNADHSYAESKPSEIIDYNGNVIIEAKDKVKYSLVSKNGYVAVLTIKDELSGMKYLYKIIDLKGNVVYEETESKIDYMGKDYFIIKDTSSYDDTSILFNAKTGQKTEYEEEYVPSYVFPKDVDYGIYEDDGKYYIINTDTSKGKRIGELDEDEPDELHKILDYKKGYALYSRYGDREYSVRTFDGKLIKDLKEGGMKQITYKDGKFAVVSETGFFYIFDESGKYIVEPVKLPSTNVKLIDNILFETSNEGLKKYSDDLKEVEVIDRNANVTSFSKISTIDNCLEISYSGTYSCKYIDMTTWEEFELKK